MAVGLIVGGWFASAVISKLINELIEYAKDQKKMQQGLKDELARLKKALPKIDAVVNAVDQGLIREKNPPLEEWLWQLRDAADQADDVIDEIKYNYEKERVLEAEKNKVNKAITNFKIFFLRAVDEDPFLQRLKEAVKAIDEVAANVGHFYMLMQDLVKDQKVVKSAISNRETSSVLNVGTRVYGRKKEKMNIIMKLLNPDCKTKGDNFAVLPVIGVGGVGKTTLVQLVYNDPTVEKHFDLRMWVCISNNFDVELLTKKLYEEAFGQRADCDTFNQIQNKLKEKLQSKRFLIVFDDAWNDDDKQRWEKLVAPLKNGKISGSMILLTTRLKAVARLTGSNVMDSIILEGLDKRGMWDLFKEYAFGDEDSNYHKELVKIGRGIVKKLKGSPLAAKTVGGILCSDLNEDHWTDVLQSELWSLKQGKNGIMPALRLTYQYLPPYLKPCFSFCSIFPQGHVFSKNDLINMWIALGMVPQRVNGTIRPEDVGSKYFDDMLSKSIFIRSNHVFQKNENFVMHDLLHDLSTLVSQGECSRTSTNKLASVPSTVRHLYAHIDAPSKLSISGLKNLHTLVLHFDESHHPKQDSLVDEMLKGMESFRILILFVRNLSKFPESVSKLLHLRYLSVSSCRISEFPKSMSKLYLLETMVYNDFGKDYDDFFGARQIKQADALGKLINLRHLIAPEWLLDGIAGVGRLTSLQELSFSVGKDSGFKIQELSDMRELRSLEIDRIDNVGSCEEVKHANLGNKDNLNKLSLKWTLTEPNLQANEDVLDHLRPHSGLKELTLTFYMGTRRPPIWFRIQALSKLVCLTIFSCNFVNLPCLEELPCLKYIDFQYLYAIERIIHECNRSSAVNAFPSLEGLSFSSIRAIEEWYLAKQPYKWMQCLRKLEVHDCPKLQILPPISVGVKELSFTNVGLNALPNLWNYQSSKSALVVMSIFYCKNLKSLTEGLLQNPERFVALEELNISNCEKLMNLPPGGFNKFILLKELNMRFCPKILVQEECFLPSTLEKLRIFNCGHLDINLPKALQSIHSLIELELSGCANITSLPPKAVFRRWKSLKRLILKDCTVLASLESLLGLSSIEYLKVSNCPKLSPAIRFPSYQNDESNKWFLACSRRALAFFLGLLCTLFYLVLKMFMWKLKISVSTQPQPPSPSSTMDRGKTSAQEKPLLSVDELVIDDPLLLSVEPLRSLSAVRKLAILDCSKLQSLPELPPILQELYIAKCCHELQRRCKKSGPDWPIVSQIPNLIIEGDNAGYLAKILNLNDAEVL